MNLSYPASIVFLFFTLGLHGQMSVPNVLEASRAPVPIVFDGMPDEAVWDSAMTVNNFTQRELNLGEPATERTEVAVLYDDKFLYIGVWCYDSNPQKIVAKELRRDFDYVSDDNFIVIIDTYNDERNGFMFVTNPNAARADLQVFNNGGSVNGFWNGVWDVRTKINSEGWFAEFKIPFYTFKYKAGLEEQEWGINFERNIRRKREQVRWQGWSRNYAVENVSQAGTLTNLLNLRDERFVEIKPYVIGGAENVDGDREGVLNGGGDINYLITPTYRLNITFNTDFAQVEADRQQINLTRFPLFFPELREFFLEGNDYFDFGFGGNRIIPFYSRRIGLNEEREAVPIIAGARLLGKENNSTLGVMSIQTAENGLDSTVNFTTASWRQDVGKQSVVGAMTTNKIEDGRWHTTTGINGRFSTAKFYGNRNLDVGGAFIYTYNTDVGLQEQSWAYRAFLSYPNDVLNIFASTQRSPPPFEPEVGLMRRRNFRESFAQVNLRPRPVLRFKWIRQFDFTPLGLTYTQYDDTGEIQSFDYNLRFFGFDTRSGERFSINYGIRAEGLLEDFEIFPGILIPQGTYWWRNWSTSFSTFNGRAFSLASQLAWGEFYEGNSLQSNTTLLWRATKLLNIDLLYERNEVELPYGNFTTDLIGARLAYAINPNIFGSALTQWNSAQDELNFNFRLQVIPKVGTDFFLIVNQIYNTSEEKLDPARGTILAKLIWRFVV